MTKRISELTPATIAALVNQIEINEAGTSKSLTILLLRQLLDITAQTMQNKTLKDFTNLIHADSEHLKAFNTTGSAMSLGSVVMISGYNIGQDLPEISLADSSVVSTMPAIGIVAEAISNGQSGEICITGRMAGLDTSSFTAGDTLYVSETTGKLTNVKPTGAALIQNIATVLRSHLTLGVIQIIALNRTNDIPNLLEGEIWQGNSSGVATATAKKDTIIVAVSDEDTVLSTGIAKTTFRMPYAFTVTEVRASLSVAGTGIALVTVDINESGSTILSTKLTIDAGEKTSTTADTAAVISDSVLADDAEMTIDIDTIDTDNVAKGLKITLIGHRTI